MIRRLNTIDLSWQVLLLCRAIKTVVCYIGSTLQGYAANDFDSDEYPPESEIQIQSMEYFLSKTM